MTISTIDLLAPPPFLPDPIWDPANPEWPAVIPDIRECQYLQLDCFESNHFLDATTCQPLTDDEVHDRALDVRRRQGFRLFALPLTHMAYVQALELKAGDFRCAAICVVSVDRENARILFDGAAYAVRLAWLQTPSTPGYSWGSANWTPERGRQLAQTLREFEQLNPGVRL